MNKKRLVPNEFSRIAETIDIKSVISRVIDLKRAGAYYRGCCPFHEESGPSFIVYPKDASSNNPNSYHCYGGGCGEHGNVIDFIQRYYNLTNFEALEWLSREFGEPLKYEDHDITPEEAKKEWLWKLNEAIVESLNSNLLSQPDNSDVRRYLRDRKITDDDIRKWKLGFGNDNFVRENFCNKSFMGNNVVWADFRDLDIDRDFFFTNRVVFPIFDLHGRPIAFSNRLFAYHEDKETQKEIENGLLERFGGKYINTSVRHNDNGVMGGSILYLKKNTHLYGLNFARQYIRKNKGKLILVEGNIDVIACHRNGFMNVAGVLSATINEDTIDTLKKCSVKRLVLCLDGDNGGKTGADKIARNIQEGRLKLQDKEYSCDLTIARLPELYHDPDTLFTGLGWAADFFSETINNAKCISEYIIDRKLEQTEFNTLTDKVNFIYEVKKDLNTNRNLNNLEKILIVESLSDKLSVSKDIVKEYLNIKDDNVTDKLVSEVSEKTVLAEMIENEESRAALLSKVSPDDYYFVANKTLHKLISELDVNRLPIDYNVLLIHCREKGLMGKYFNDTYFQALRDTVRANVDFHAEKIVEYSKKRKLHSFGNKIKDSVFEQEDVYNIIGSISKDLYSLNSSESDAFKSPRDEAFEYSKQIFKRCRNPGIDLGFQTGFPIFDDATQGLFPGQTMLILARTSDGKTALAQNIACNMALRRNDHIPIYYANLEMPPMQMLDRMMSIYTGIPARRIASGHLSRSSEEQLMMAINQYAIKNSLHIQFIPDFTISKLATNLRYHIEKNGVKLCVVDYVQLMTVDKEYASLSTSEQLGMISRGITSLAKLLNIPIIIVAQANRDTVTGNNGRPELQNIYGSDKFSHDVDIAVSLQSKSFKQQEGDGWLTPEEMIEKGYELRDENGCISQAIYEKLKIGKRGNYWLHVLKNRKGQKDTKINLWFHKFKITFEEVKNSLEAA